MLILPRLDVIDPYFIYCTIFKFYGQMLLRPILSIIMVHVLKEPCGYQGVTNLHVVRLLFRCLFVILV